MSQTRPRMSRLRRGQGRVLHQSRGLRVSKVMFTAKPSFFALTPTRSERDRSCTCTMLSPIQIGNTIVPIFDSSPDPTPPALGFPLAFPARPPKTPNVALVGSGLLRPWTSLVGFLLGLGFTDVKITYAGAWGERQTRRTYSQSRWAKLRRSFAADHPSKCCSAQQV